jgi:hypothetical protein
MKGHLKKRKDSSQFPQNGNKKILEIPIQKVIASYQKKRVELFVSFGNGYLFCQTRKPILKVEASIPNNSTKFLKHRACENWPTLYEHVITR